jgi:ketosteroid isomerase-like protein
MDDHAKGIGRLSLLAIAIMLTLPLFANAATLSLLPKANPTVSTMTDEEQIRELYKKMCRAMIDKDTATLSALHDNDFVLVHMTGMRQSKKQYIDAIADGTLNYFSVRHDALEASIEGDTATLLAKSYVSAAVFGGGRHSWRLQLDFRLCRRNGQWLFSHCKASTY